MSLDALLGDLVRENEGALLPLVRKAYELGYREALAARPPLAPEPVAAAAVAPPVMAPLFADSPAAEEPTPDGAGEAQEDDEEDDDGTRPVRGSLTVGGLVKKITRHFGLERFALEVRVVDPRSHRHLMRDVRLSRYQLEEK